MAEGTGSGNILTWNVPNWITVVLMATVGFFLVGLAQKWYANRASAS
jgi:hypothetical protein